MAGGDSPVAGREELTNASVVAGSRDDGTPPAIRHRLRRPGVGASVVDPAASNAGQIEAWEKAGWLRVRGRRPGADARGLGPGRPSGAGVEAGLAPSGRPTLRVPRRRFARPSRSAVPLRPLACSRCCARRAVREPEQGPAVVRVVLQVAAVDRFGLAGAPGFEQNRARGTGARGNGRTAVRRSGSCPGGPRPSASRRSPGPSGPATPGSRRRAGARSVAPGWNRWRRRCAAPRVQGSAAACLAP